MKVSFCLIAGLLLCAGSTECIRTLQSGSYKPQRGYAKIVVSRYYLVLSAVQIVCLLLLKVSANKWWFTAVFCALAVIVCAKKRKTPLVLTKRVWRLLTVNFAIIVLFAYFFNIAYAPALLPLFTFVSWAITLPAECTVNAYYLLKCRKRIISSGASVIAITGSYAKTSVKDMLAVLLPNAITADGSCNTPLGIAKFVNNSSLFSEANLLKGKYLVLEFGARKRGDIRRLCKLCLPFYGIVTGVCGQHLKTFGTLKNVAETKRELVENLPQNGCCVLNGGDETVRSFADYGKCKKVLSDCVKISELHCTTSGTDFYCETNGQREFVWVDQFSVAVAKNFSLCVALMSEMGFPLNVAVQNAKKLQCTPHRMQLVNNGRFYILDDSYNASLPGVTACAETLLHFNCTKIGILQGIVEAGKQSYLQNVQVGQMLGGVCDVAIVVGANKVALAEGVLGTTCRLLTANSLQQAVEKAGEYLSENALLLFQNDLPDNINL